MSRSLQDQQLYRFVFGVRPSPSILGATISHHLKKYKQSEPQIAKLLEESLCIDDLITGEDNVNKAFSVYEESRQIMSAKVATTPGNVESSHEFVKVLLKSWTLLLEELRCLNSVRIPRCYFQTTRNASYMVFVTPLIKRTPLLFIFSSYLFRWKNWRSFGRLEISSSAPKQTVYSTFGTIGSCSSFPTWKQIRRNCVPIENLQLDRFDDRLMLYKKTRKYGNNMYNIASKRFENWPRATVGDIALVNSIQLIYLQACRKQDLVERSIVSLQTGSIMAREQTHATRRWSGVKGSCKKQPFRHLFLGEHCRSWVQDENQSIHRHKPN